MSIARGVTRRARSHCCDSCCAARTSLFGVPATNGPGAVSAHVLMHVTDGRVPKLFGMFDEAGLRQPAAEIVQYARRIRDAYKPNRARSDFSAAARFSARDLMVCAVAPTEVSALVSLRFSPSRSALIMVLLS